jgi:hypothetical protein
VIVPCRVGYAVRVAGCPVVRSVWVSWVRQDPTVMWGIVCRLAAGMAAGQSGTLTVRPTVEPTPGVGADAELWFTPDG